MSRIDQALEKAALLRKGLGNDGGGKTLPADDSPPVPVHTYAMPDKATSGVHSDNPLIVTLNAPHSPVSEEYRKLKSAIVSSARQGVKRNVIMVTSSIGGEGKSVTSLNLAISLAQEFDHTVLLVDADLRKPSINKYLGLKSGKGFSDCLSGEALLPDVLIKTGIGKLTVLPAGTPRRNPVELFSSQMMKDFINEIKSRYPDRYVIIDTPPVLPFAESRMLGALVDGIVLVIREGATTVDDVRETVDVLPKGKMLGAVYNVATVDSLSGRYHYYYHGYGYHADAGEGQEAAAVGSDLAAGKPRLFGRLKQPKAK
ncbi:polysaccharide biosynthesis protein [Geotalea uraniireducens]|uniref:Polysaccharide biosynthesis protein n=1 Tax=Geotalea uraniireducens TaxID=351604 RepID=A0ABM8EKF3_9BACT|nr:XrtA-associated tyrosine autokinase [Geotalea uraniireducens]BDV43029.1 polysaccharide biosynthesis protein [Geotalea uraniireducens]